MPVSEAPLSYAATTELGGFDVVLIAHGALGNQLETERSFDAAEAIFRTNLLSVVAFLVPLVKFHLSTAEGNVVTGTGPGWVRVGADVHRESLVIAPDTILKPWAATFEALDQWLRAAEQFRSRK